MNITAIVLKIKELVKKHGNFRMSHWFLTAIFFYAIAIGLASYGLDFYPQAQTVSWKLGHITIASYLGYWIDRSAFRTRLNNESNPLSELRRAVIMAAAMLAVSLGL